MNHRVMDKDMAPNLEGEIVMDKHIELHHGNVPFPSPIEAYAQPSKLEYHCKQHLQNINVDEPREERHLSGQQIPSHIEGHHHK